MRAFVKHSLNTVSKMINHRSTKTICHLSCSLPRSSTSPATCWWRVPCQMMSSPRRRKGSVRGSTSAREASWDCWSRLPGPSRWWVLTLAQWHSGWNITLSVRRAEVSSLCCCVEPCVTAVSTALSKWLSLIRCYFICIPKLN